jgi:hypothetical protein
MPVSNLNRWATISCCFLMIVLGLPASGFSGGPCTCNDLAKLEQRLKAVEAQLAAWEQVGSEAIEKLLPTAGWAQNRFIQIAFPGQTPRQRGSQKYGEQPKVSDEEKENNCDGIWKATQQHEEDHAKFDQSIPDWQYNWSTIFGQEGVWIAAKEISGHTAEAAYLQEEINKLRKQCSKLETYPETYDDKTRRAEQKERLGRAADRVASYASSLD